VAWILNLNHSLPFTHYFVLIFTSVLYCVLFRTYKLFLALKNIYNNNNYIFVFKDSYIPCHLSFYTRLYVLFFSTGDLSTILIMIIVYFIGNKQKSIYYVSWRWFDGVVKLPAYQTTCQTFNSCVWYQLLISCSRMLEARWVHNFSSIFVVQEVGDSWPAFTDW